MATQPANQETALLMPSATSIRLLLALLVFAFCIDSTRAEAPPRSIRDITALLDQYKPDPAKAKAVRQILEQLPPDTPDKKDLARACKERADAAEEVGAEREHVTAMRKVIESGGEWDFGEDLQPLADAESMAGGS